MATKLNGYEYPLKDEQGNTYYGYYSVIDGCPNEKALADQLKAKKVDSFER